MSPLHIRTIPGSVWPPLPDGSVGQVWAAFQMLEHTQWLPPAELEQRQLEQLRSVLAHAVLHVPYYREVLPAAGVVPGAIRGMDDLRRLPVLTREIWQQRQADLHTEQLPPGTVAAGGVSSSGSSGIPVRVRQTNVVNLWWCACFLRDLAWTNIDPTGTLAAIRATRETGPALARLFQGVPQGSWLPQLASLLDTGPVFLMDIQQDPRHQLEWLRQIAPDYLLSLPTNVGLLANLVAEQGPLPSLRGIQTIAEPMPAEARSRIETAFGVPVHDLYSCSEAGYLATPCPAGHGLHVHSENVILEVLDEAGRPCPPGATGKVYVTTLHNYRAPFVRYELMDEVTLAAAPCPCGRGLPLLTRVLGKTRPTLCLPDGRRRNGAPLTNTLAAIPGVRQFQIVQQAIDRVVIHIAAAPGWPAEQADTVRRKAHEFFEGLVQVSLVVEERLPLPPNGKFQCLVNEVKA